VRNSAERTGLVSTRPSGRLPWLHVAAVGTNAGMVGMAVDAREDAADAARLLGKDEEELAELAHMQAQELVDAEKALYEPETEEDKAAAEEEEEERLQEEAAEYTAAQAEGREEVVETEEEREDAEVDERRARLEEMAEMIVEHQDQAEAAAERGGAVQAAAQQAWVDLIARSRLPQLTCPAADAAAYGSCLPQPESSGHLAGVATGNGLPRSGIGGGRPCGGARNFYPDLVQALRFPRDITEEPHLLIHLGGQLDMRPAFGDDEFDGVRAVQAERDGEPMDEADWFAAEAEVLERMRDRYRSFLNTPHLRHVMATVPQLMLHTLTDVFAGTERGAGLEKHPLGLRMLRRCARQVWQEYQRQLWDPACVHRDLEIDVPEQAFFRYGDTGIYMMDMMTSRIANFADGTRRWDEPLLSAEQVTHFSEVLNTEGLRCLVIVTERPVVWYSSQQAENADEKSRMEIERRQRNEEARAWGQAEEEDPNPDYDPYAIQEHWAWHEDLLLEMLENLFEWKALGQREVMLLSGGARCGVTTEIKDRITASTITQLCAGPAFGPPEKMDAAPVGKIGAEHRFTFTHEEHPAASRPGGGHASGANGHIVPGSGGATFPNNYASVKVLSDTGTFEVKPVVQPPKAAEAFTWTAGKGGTEGGEGGTTAGKVVHAHVDEDGEEHHVHIHPGLPKGVVGPVIGKITSYAVGLGSPARATARILLQVDQAGEVTCELTDALAGGRPRLCTAKLLAGEPFVFFVDHLRPNRRYRVQFKGICNPTERVGVVVTPDAAFSLPDGAVDVASFNRLQEEAAAELAKKKAREELAGVPTDDRPAEAVRAIFVACDRPHGLHGSELHPDVVNPWKTLRERLETPFCGIDVVVHAGGQVWLQRAFRECMTWLAEVEKLDQEEPDSKGVLNGRDVVSTRPTSAKAIARPGSAAGDRPGSAKGRGGAGDRPGSAKGGKERNDPDPDPSTAATAQERQKILLVLQRRHVQRQAEAATQAAAELREKRVEE
jgi:hypothetical protein